MKSILNRSRNIVIAAAVVLLALAPVKSNAQAKPLNFALTAVYQAPDNTSADGFTTISTTKTVRITASSLLTLVGTNNTPSLKSYTLVFNPTDGTLGATNSKTGDFVDLSSILSIDLTGTSVQAGSVNSTSGKENESITTYAAISFDNGAGTAFTLNGLVKQSVSVPVLSTAQQNNGATAVETITVSGTVSGTGTIVGSDGTTDNAVFSGTVSGSGKSSS